MVSTLPPSDTQQVPGAPARTIERRVGLPSGRAVVGALLMTVAALGVFLAFAGANEDPRSGFVVAARSIPAGTTLQADDLEIVRLDLESPVDRQSFGDLDFLTGARLIVPVGEGELIQRSAISQTPGDGPRNEFTFRIGASRAVNGDLRAGDLIDIYVTSDRRTTTVARNVMLIGRPVEAGRGDLVLRLAIDDEAVVLAVVDAINTGDITIVRTTHADNGDGPLGTGDDAPSLQVDAGGGNSEEEGG